ncbi:mannan-binding lectin [Sorangium sp. So ce1335]|uniref:mannan-binding lectin n=1 Tax=Sorangium sp. So ce1335 TaxID=3133335 RepID=UPI003F644343
MNIQRVITSFLTSSALGIMLIAGCSAPSGEGDPGEAISGDEIVNDAPQALSPACVAENLALEAGPIWSNADAPTKCTGVCDAQNMDWGGQWWTTVSGEMSVCECSPRPPAVVEAGPIWSNIDAQTKCPDTCAGFDSATAWNGQWWTTVWGEMSVCECAYAPPARVSLEAGPIWNNGDAAGKCAAACGDTRAWDGEWTTTVWGEMSVCGCACAP